MTRLRISLGATTREDSALIRRLEGVPASRQAEYIRRLLSIGMVAVYGPGLNGIPDESLPDEIPDSPSTGFRTRIRLDGIDRIERRLLSNLGLVTDAKKHLFVRRLLLAGVKCLYGDTLATHASSDSRSAVSESRGSSRLDYRERGAEQGRYGESDDDSPSTRNAPQNDEGRRTQDAPAPPNATAQPANGLIGLMG